MDPADSLSSRTVSVFPSTPRVAAMKRILRALRAWLPGERKPPRPIRLAVELLEDRVVPAVDFRSAIGADAVQDIYPYRGTGYTVAVLDTGIDYNHADLGGGFGAGKRVVAGYDFINNDADPMDDHGHGTHLAGIIGSSNPNSAGIAPDVRFVALKVLDANMNGNWNAVEKALQWVIANRTKYNIVDVNLSLGSGNYTTNPYALLEDEFSTLRSSGIFTAVAAGNRYYTFGSQVGLSYPSISSNVVSVGATWADSYAAPARFSTGAQETKPTADHIVSFTQRSSALSILAPGAWITSTWRKGGYQPMGGTSMATAVVSGAATLLHEAYDRTGKTSLATQDNLLKLMQATGVAVVDRNYGTDNVAHTNLTFKRLDLKAAIDTVGQPVAPPTLAPIPDQTLPVGSTIVVPLDAASPTGRAITFTYTQVYIPALAYQLDQLHNFNYLGSYYQNGSGLNERWIIGANSVWYAILPSGEVRRWTGSVGDMMTSANLVATLDPSYWTDPSKLWNAPYAGMPPAVFSLSGNNLSIRSPSYWLGAYTVIITASDGLYSVRQSFKVNQVPANAPPLLGPIANQTMAHAQDKLTLNLTATDADKDPITFSAQVLPINGTEPAVGLALQGNQLTINPAITLVGRFTVQVAASDGKASAATTFTVTVTNTDPALGAISDQTLSHGQDATVALKASDADGDVLTYAARALPVNGQSPALSVVVEGNQVTVHPTQPLVGTFAIEATVSDGAASATRTFNLTFTNAAPTLAAVSPQTMAKGQTSATLTLSAADADGDALTFQAQVRTPDATLYQLDQTYGFQPSSANYYYNLLGYNEKWLIGKNNIWYVLLPTGKLHRWNLSMAQTLTAANLIATVDPSVSTEPRLLWNAQPPVTPALTIAWNGNQMTIQRPATLTGVFFMDVIVSDGLATQKRTIQLTLH